ncbi:hypothetical protein B0H12DRAFT_447735 [Mycena haematopus]|nr:hypothetical protein B0H12DRAFT_447735 [Mycena haematopus]
MSSTTKMGLSRGVSCPFFRRGAVHRICGVEKGRRGGDRGRTRHPPDARDAGLRPSCPSFAAVLFIVSVGCWRREDEEKETVCLFFRCGAVGRVPGVEEEGRRREGDGAMTRLPPDAHGACLLLRALFVVSVGWRRGRRRGGDGGRARLSYDDCLLLPALLSLRSCSSCPWGGGGGKTRKRRWSVGKIMRWTV